jgi:predicted DNA-binding transcriptional regulator YafY
MLETSARLLRLLSLLQSRPDWGGPELARRLAVTPRTLRRDVARLRDLGYPVHASTGVAGGYRLGAGASLPPLLLDDEEAVAVAVSLRTAASQSVAGLAETSLRALAKLEQVLPARLRSRTTAIGQATVALPRTAPAVDPGLLSTLATACRDTRLLEFGYRARDGQPSQRRAEPFRLVHTGYRWYLVARDTSRQDWRTFRVDRIEPPVTSGARFTRHDPPDAAGLVAHAVTTAPYRYQVKALVHAPVAAVAEHITPTAGILDRAGPDRCLLTAGIEVLDVMLYQLAGLGAEVDILEPPELISRARELAAWLQRAAGREPGNQPERGPG